MSIYDVVCRIIWVWCKYHAGGGLGVVHRFGVLTANNIVRVRVLSMAMSSMSMFRQWLYDKNYTLAHPRIKCRVPSVSPWLKTQKECAVLHIFHAVLYCIYFIMLYWWTAQLEVRRHHDAMQRTRARKPGEKELAPIGGGRRPLYQK